MIQLLLSTTCFALVYYSKYKSNQNVNSDTKNYLLILTHWLIKMKSDGTSTTTSIKLHWSVYNAIFADADHYSMNHTVMVCICKTFIAYRSVQFDWSSSRCPCTIVWGKASMRQTHWFSQLQCPSVPDRPEVGSSIRIVTHCMVWSIDAHTQQQVYSVISQPISMFGFDHIWVTEIALAWCWVERYHKVGLK